MNLTKKKPIRQEIKTIEMMLHTTTKTIDVYIVEITNINKNFSMSSEVNCVDRPVLLTLQNPRYREVIASNSHREGIEMDDVDTKPMLPVHMILGASDYL
jgi:predicted glycosyltransferase